MAPFAIERDVASGAAGLRVGHHQNRTTGKFVNAAAQLGGVITVSVGDDVVEISVVGESTRGNDLLKLALALLQRRAWTMKR